MKRAHTLQSNNDYCPKCGRIWQKCICFDLIRDVKQFAREQGWPVVDLTSGQGESKPNPPRTEQRKPGKLARPKNR